MKNKLIAWIKKMLGIQSPSAYYQAFAEKVAVPTYIMVLEELGQIFQQIAEEENRG